MLVDRYGRKATIIFNAALFTLGALTVAFSNSLGWVLLGRLILGFAVSLSAIAECIYIAEISTPNRRGGLVSLNELGITVGKVKDGNSSLQLITIITLLIIHSSVIYSIMHYRYFSGILG